MKNLILASTSKYRQELLGRLNLPFQAISPGVDEEPFKSLDLSPKDLAQKLAFEKASAVAQKFPGAVVIGSDQVAAIKSKILDKPGDHQTATNQLSFLSGKEHVLLTAVCICYDGKTIEFLDETTLAMKQLSASQIDRYLKYDQPYDCAGSYKIESLGISLFESIDCADFNAITGLPLLKLSKYLSDIGYELP